MSDPNPQLPVRIIKRTPLVESWHWPDHVIGKRESRRLREDHNEVYNQRAELLQALQDLAKEIDLSKLNVRRDFSLMNAHACALRVIHKANSRTRGSGGAS